MEFVMTVTRQTCDPMQYPIRQEDCEVTLVEKRGTQGAALLWIKQWFKTTGANRTEQKRGKGRTVFPEEYAHAEIMTQLPVYGNEDYREAYTPDILATGYARNIGYYRSQNERFGIDTSAYIPDFGVRQINIYSKKRPEWFTLWLKVLNDDGNEIDPLPYEDEWV